MSNYYHLTPFNNLKSINKNGLIPQIGKLSRIALEKVSAIYLFSSIENVQNALDNWFLDQFRSNARIALLSINIDGIDTDKLFKSGFEDFFEIKVLQKIDVKFINTLSKNVAMEKYEFFSNISTATSLIHIK